MLDTVRRSSGLIITAKTHACRKHLYSFCNLSFCVLGSHGGVGYDSTREQFKTTINSIVQKDEFMHAFSDRVLLFMYYCQMM